jgi:tetratricopeptide (TPR) repeat protein
MPIGAALTARNFQLEEALVDLDKAVKLDPDIQMAYANHGGVYALTGDYENALADLIRAVQMAPSQVPSLLNRAGVRYELGNIEEAFQDYDQVIRLDPANAIAYASRGYSYWD